MNRIVIFVVSAIAVALTSCALAPITQTYQVSSYDKAWQCALSSATQLGVTVISSSKDGGTISGGKSTDTINITLTNSKSGVDIGINRTAGMYGISTTKSFPEDFSAKFQSCISVTK